MEFMHLPHGQDFSQAIWIWMGLRVMATKEYSTLSREPHHWIQLSIIPRKPFLCVCVCVCVERDFFARGEIQSVYCKPHQQRDMLKEKSDNIYIYIYIYIYISTFMYSPTAHHEPDVTKGQFFRGVKLI